MQLPVLLKMYSYDEHVQFYEPCAGQLLTKKPAPLY
jgi:hypothetical protein